jgi:hypothetical protein
MNTDSTDTNLTPEPAPAPETEDFAAFERRTLGREEPAEADPQPDPSEADPEGDEPEGEGEDEAGEEEQPRKGKTAKERIDELTTARRQAERDAEYWRGVAEGRIKPQAEPQPEATDDRDPNAGPDPAEYEYGESDPKYLVALARHEARQEFEEQRQREAIEREVTELEQGWKSRAETAKEKYADFDEKVIASADRGEWPCPLPLALGIMQSEVGDDIAYHLASNPDEAKRIAALPDLQMAREFGRLEARFMTPAAQPQKKIATDAPEPAPSRTRGAGGKFAPDDDTTDFAAFEAKYGSKGRR